MGIPEPHICVPLLVAVFGVKYYSENMPWMVSGDFCSPRQFLYNLFCLDLFGMLHLVPLLASLMYMLTLLTSFVRSEESLPWLLEKLLY